ncbi:MAG TPA: TIGR03790 family protein [Desulfuromonadales bacterium]|nr:TIGR03790 family protein [Desulfuromonadales bacterium]
MIFLLLTPVSALALEPAEVAVVVNSFVTDSVKLARYYMEQRGIPRENLISVNFKPRQTISREDYLEDVAQPVRKALAKRRSGAPIRCLVTMTGMPLTVAQPALSSAEKKQLDILRRNLKAARNHLAELPASKEAVAQNLKHRIESLGKEIAGLQRKNERAALDSELSLVKVADPQLANWLPNPYFVPFQKSALEISKEDVLIVSRLDAPSIAIIRRMINDGLAAEEQGLHGKAYFDARYPKTERKDLKSYALYDQSIHKAAEYLQSLNKMPVIINDEARLFGEGEAPAAALYCGWYSLARYVDAFDWVPGAVGYHIASQECQTLRGNGRYWCKSMLEDGAAATIGPVAEPYLTAFPVPELFFRFLTDGFYTLGEAYFLSVPYLSWQMILVGDPLYRPFKKQPADNL